jgi:antirestriction protein ArdC
MNQTEKNDVYQIVTDRVLELLDKGVVPWRKPWSGVDGQTPMNLVSGKPYRGINVFLLSACGYGSPYWLSFKQCKERGGFVRAGEKSSLAVFWKIYKKEVDGEEKEIRLLRYYRVFNVEQCEGINYPKPEPKAVDFNPIAEAQGLIERMPNRPRLTHIENQAYYRRSIDTVNMPKPETFDGAAEYYCALFHEHVHATGHPTRLNRFKEEDNDVVAFGGEKYAKEELTAEMGAAFLCAISGIVDQTIDNSAAYIASWKKRIKDDRKLVVHAAARAQRAADYIQGITYQNA